MKFNKATKNLLSEEKMVEVRNVRLLKEYGLPSKLDNPEVIATRLLKKLKAKYGNKKLTETDITDIGDEIDDEFMGAYDYSGDYDNMKEIPVNKAIDAARHHVMDVIGTEFGINHFVGQADSDAYNGGYGDHEEGDSIDDEFGEIW